MDSFYQFLNFNCYFNNAFDIMNAYNWCGNNNYCFNFCNTNNSIWDNSFFNFLDPFNIFNNKKTGPVKKYNSFSVGSKITKYNDIIEKYAREYNVEPAFIKAVIFCESSFNPNAESKIKGKNVGAMGLMQLMPATAKSMGVTDPWDPEQNIRGGVKLLRQLLDRYKGNKELAAAAYNAGPAKVKNSIPKNKQTEYYVPRVMDAYRQYRA